MKCDPLIRIVIIFGLILSLFLCCLCVEAFIYDANKSSVVIETIDNLPEVNIETENIPIVDIYETSSDYKIRQERMVYGKKLYSQEDYFAAREEFYIADIYNSNDAAYLIRLCNKQLKAIEEAEVLLTVD